MTHEFTVTGHAGRIVGRRWPNPEPRWVAVLCHGYGEHVGRYEWVASRLSASGASVYGADHVGHGRSDGERVLIEDVDHVVDDLQQVVELAAEENPGLPLILIGHSMGGLIAARHAQLHRDRLTALVLSGPVLGSWWTVDDLLALDEIPSTPIDPGTLSRDPAVGEAYAADELVWHGDFRRPTLQALDRAMQAVTATGRLGTLPVLYLHGEADELVPMAPSTAGFEAIRGERATTITYPDARHEIFNETNREEVLGDVVSFVTATLGEEAGR